MISQNQLKLTLFVQAKAAENFPLATWTSYTFFYDEKIYKIRENILDYSDYILNYFETNLEARWDYIDIQICNKYTKLRCSSKITFCCQGCYYSKWIMHASSCFYRGID